MKNQQRKYTLAAASQFLLWVFCCFEATASTTRISMASALCVCHAGQSQTVRQRACSECILSHLATGA